MQASGSGRALLEFDSTVVVTLGVPSSANTAVDKAEQSSTALLKFFGLEANATNPTLEDLGQMLEEAAQEGSQAFQAVEAVVESALDNAGIEANFTVGGELLLHLVLLLEPVIVLNSSDGAQQTPII